MNFYQHALRIYINKHIYKKPTFEVDLLGTTYTGIVKTKKQLGKTFNRYMIHGVQLGDLDMYNEEITTNLAILRRDFAKSSGDIFFQLGCVDLLEKTKTSLLKQEGGSDALLTKKKYQQSQLLERYGLRPSRREHMPNATIQLDLRKTLPELKSDFSSSGKRYLNKAKKHDLHFSEATEKEWEKFRTMRYAMAYDKGFYVVPKEDFLGLMRYLQETKQGTLLLSKKGKNIVSGSVVLFVDKTLVYLYGATDRSYGSIGSHYRLMYETMRWAHTKEFTTFDLLGVAPPGEEAGHHLEGVTRFKQAFGGKTISSVGNYDLVFNKLLYKVFKVMKR